MFNMLDNKDAPFDVLCGDIFMSKYDGAPTEPVLINAGKPLSTSMKIVSTVTEINANKLGLWRSETGKPKVLEMSAFM